LKPIGKTSTSGLRRIRPRFACGVRYPGSTSPGEFNKAFVTPAAVHTQCVSCHQADPFITSPFVNAAKIPGTDENVVPILDKDSPYYVIGGENWDMRTIYIQGHACFDCHRVGMKTVELFTAAGWDPNEHMPPHDPGSLADELVELLDAWKKGPENLEGAEWIIPPAHGKDRQVVGDDYPYKAGFNKPGASPILAGLLDSFLGGKGNQKTESNMDLWNAAKAENIDEVKQNLAKGTDVNAKNDMGLTPLMLAAFTGQTEAMKYLIQKGANVK